MHHQWTRDPPNTCAPNHPCNQNELHKRRNPSLPRWFHLATSMQSESSVEDKQLKTFYSLNKPHCTLSPKKPLHVDKIRISLKQQSMSRKRGIQIITKLRRSVRIICERFSTSIWPTTFSPSKIPCYRRFLHRRTYKKRNSEKDKAKLTPRRIDKEEKAKKEDRKVKKREDKD